MHDDAIGRPFSVPDVSFRHDERSIGGELPIPVCSLSGPLYERLERSEDREAVSFLDRRARERGQGKVVDADHDDNAPVVMHLEGHAALFSSGGSEMLSNLMVIGGISHKSEWSARSNDSDVDRHLA